MSKSQQDRHEKDHERLAASKRLYDAASTKNDRRSFGRSYRLRLNAHLSFFHPEVERFLTDHETMHENAHDASTPGLNYAVAVLKGSRDAALSRQADTSGVSDAPDAGTLAPPDVQPYYGN